MKRSVKPLLLATLLAGVAFATVAQPGTPASHAPCHAAADGERHGGRFERMKARMSERADALKATLQLRPEQEAAWNSYLAALQPPADLARPARADLRELTTPQRLDRMAELRKAHDAAFTQRDAATRAFYAQLDAAQQKAFDAQTARRMHGHDRHRHHDRRS